MAYLEECVAQHVGLWPSVHLASSPSTAFIFDFWRNWLNPIAVGEEVAICDGEMYLGQYSEESSIEMGKEKDEERASIMKLFETCGTFFIHSKQSDRGKSQTTCLSPCSREFMYGSVTNPRSEANSLFAIVVICRGLQPERLKLGMLFNLIRSPNLWIIITVCNCETE